MDLTPTAEQQALSEMMRELVSDVVPPSRMAELADAAAPLDKQLWSRLAKEAGVTGLLVASEHGGVGAGWREVSEVVAALGQALANVPYISSCVIAPTVLGDAVDDPQAPGLLARISAGGIVAVAMSGRDGGITPSSLDVEAIRGEGGWQLSGMAGHVEYGAVADVLLVLASTEDADLGWFVVDPSGSGGRIEPMRVLDATRPMSSVHLDATPAHQLSLARPAGDVTERATNARTTALACESHAAAGHLLDLTIQYARERVQFGRPIGSFQAIQHRCADMAVRVDEAASARALAVEAADTDAGWSEAASLAAVVGVEAFQMVAREAIQVHGGIGFTWEHVAHRYFRRSHATAALSGGPRAHRERMLTALGL